MLYQNEIDDAETVDEFSYFLVDKVYPQLSEYRLCLAENAVGVRDGLFNLVYRVLLLNIMQSVFQI